MGKPDDVVITVTVDRLVRVITSTMVIAHRYKENWPAFCLSMLESMARELNPLLDTLGRSLDKELPTSVFGIVLTEWAFWPDQPRYTVCYSDFGWVLAIKPGNVVYLDCPRRLANAIGNDIGGAQMFIEACAYAVEQLFQKRHERLKQSEQGCLLWRISEAFDRSKWQDTKHFIDGLSLPPE